MKYNAHVFLPVNAKGTSEVTQTAQFILRGVREQGEVKQRNGAGGKKIVKR